MIQATARMVCNKTIGGTAYYTEELTDDYQITEGPSINIRPLDGVSVNPSCEEVKERGFGKLWLTANHYVPLQINLLF